MLGYLVCVLHLVDITFHFTQTCLNEREEDVYDACLKHLMDIIRYLLKQSNMNALYSCMDFDECAEVPVQWV